MKTFFSLLFLLPFCLFAQENTWFEPTTTWTYNYGTIAGPDHYQVTFGVEETTFAGMACAKIDTDNFPFLCFPVSPPYYFYETNDSIFFATQVDSTFRMVFDFNAMPGETWIHAIPIEFNNGYQPFLVEVMAVNEVTISGIIVKELILSYTNPFMPPPYLDLYPEDISVLQFIGATTGFFVPLGQIGACDHETDIKLQCFNSPSIDYTNPEFGNCFLSATSAPEPVELKIYPNPAREHITIDIDLSGNSTLKIMQIDGKTVYTKTIHSGSEKIKLPSLSAGIYLVEVANVGAKYMGKLKIW